MAAALGGVLGAINLDAVLRQGRDILDRIQRFSVDTALKMYDTFKDPSKGVPLAIVVYRITELIPADPNYIGSILDSVASNLEALDPFSIWPPQPPNPGQIWSEVTSSLPTRDCGAPPNPLLDPAGVIGYIACNILNGLITLGQGVLFIARFILDGLRYVFTLLWDAIVLAISRVAAFFVRYIAKPVIVSIVLFIRYLRDLIKWGCCEYLKLAPIVVAGKHIVEGMLRGDVSITKTLFSQAKGFLMYFIVISLAAPECAPFSQPSPPPSPPAPFSPLAPASASGLESISISERVAIYGPVRTSALDALNISEKVYVEKRAGMVAAQAVDAISLSEMVSTQVVRGAVAVSAADSVGLSELVDVQKVIPAPPSIEATDTVGLSEVVSLTRRAMETIDISEVISLDRRPMETIDISEVVSIDIRRAVDRVDISERIYLLVVRPPLDIVGISETVFIHVEHQPRPA